MERSSATQSTRKIPLWFLMAIIVVLIIAVSYFVGNIGSASRRIHATRLRCIVNQDVTILGDRILYYDGINLFCLSATGAELWKSSVGTSARFSAGDRAVVVWTDTQLQILDRNGRSTYNDRLTEPIQFARIGERYVAIVSGSSTAPTLTIKDLEGNVMDTEETAYRNEVMLDCGFFGNGEYLWTTSLDVFGAVPETTLRTYVAAHSNSATVSLGEPITYAIVYSGNYLNVINTRRMRLFDYRGSESTADTVLVYGWQLIDSYPTRSYPYLLFAPVLQKDETGSITELRLLHGQTDTRYSLPSTCVGAAFRSNKLYAFSDSSIYKADISSQRFSALNLPVDGAVTDYLGITSNGYALLVCGTAVWSVSLP